MCDTTGVTVTSVSLRNPDLSPIGKEDSHNHHTNLTPSSKSAKHGLNTNLQSSPSGNNDGQSSGKQNQVGNVMLCGVQIVSLVMDGKERLCLAQISSTLLKLFSYNEIHNRRVALGICCVQCTPVQLEILRRAGAMPVTSRRCGMITRREAERLCQSFLGDHAPPRLPENFAFEVYHECGWGSRGSFVPSRYNSSRAKCIRCTYCQLFFSPNKFIFHSHRLPESRYVQPDAANFNSWRRHLKLCGDPPDDDIAPNTLSMDTAQIVHAWEDVRAMFNGGTRKRMLAAHSIDSHNRRSSSHVGKGSSSSALNHNHLQNTSPTANLSSSRATTPHHHLGQQNNTKNIHNNNGHNNHHHNLTNQPSGGGGGGFTSESPSNPQSTNPLLAAVPSQLISPSARLETIWNPGIGSGTNGNSGRIAPLSGSSSLPHLPFHPLSIPWLRRPLFPFPHPFSPSAACHLLGDPTSGMSVPEKLAAVRQMNHSAFKPVSSRNPTEHLFTWLNNNNPLSNAGSIIGATGFATSLPEDLSLHSNNNNNNITNFTPGINLEESFNLSKEKGTHQHQTTQVSTTTATANVSSTNETESGGRKSNKSICRHQIQILSSATQNDSDDEENVDIESTEIEECSSTSSIWVPSGQGSSISGSGNNNNNNSTLKRKRKRSVDSSSGEDEKVYSGGDDDSPKRKRLWDFDSSVESNVGGNKKSNEMNYSTSTTASGHTDDDTDPNGF